MKLSFDERIAGVLVPVFAVRGKDDLGIGDTWSLMEFIDWAAATGFRLVKILPINETGGDHSPYNALSSRALEPTTLRVSPEAIPDLRADDFAAAMGGAGVAALDGELVDYEAIKPLKRKLLEAAFARFERNHFAKKTARAQEFARFTEEEAGWLGDYTLFRMLFEEHGGERWDRWPEEQRSVAAARTWLAGQRTRRGQAIEKRLRFFQYVQWLAFEQWRRVKAHATERGVALMGDIPFGVSFHSADVWAHPEVFRTDWCGGTPPDRVFKHDPFVQKWGQNWGIPLYDWEKMRADGFAWWRQRVRGVREFFHLFRIDHVLGFYRIYGFPWRPEENAAYLERTEDEARAATGGELPHFQPRPDDTAEHKAQNCRDGEEYLRTVVEEAGEGSVIGEDLGEVPDYVRPNLTSLKIAGYKIPAWENRPDGNLIPGSEYERLSLATYGTHDHAPLRSTWEELVAGSDKPEGDTARREMWALWRYAGNSEGEPARTFTPELHEQLLRALFASNSWIAVVMITDLFARTERFNFPGVASGGNWTRRMHAPVSALYGDPIGDKAREILQATGRGAAGV